MRTRRKIKRRDFLKTGALFVAGTAAAASGLLPAAAEAKKTAAKIAVFKPHQAQTLLKMTRQIYPHPAVADSVYAKVVEELGAEASKDKSVAQLLNDGVANLDSKGTHFVELADEQQIEALKSIQDTTPCTATKRSGSNTVTKDLLSRSVATSIMDSTTSTGCRSLRSRPARSRREAG